MSLQSKLSWAKGDGTPKPKGSQYVANTKIYAVAPNRSILKPIATADPKKRNALPNFRVINMTATTPAPKTPAAKKTTMFSQANKDFVDELGTIMKSTKRKLPWETDAPHARGKSKQDVTISLSDEQRTIFDMVVNQKKSLFFTGSAGSGKSHLLRCIIRELRTRYESREVAITAPTGIAACNISGCTLHSFAGMGLAVGQREHLLAKVLKSKKALERWRACKVLVIDEISMVDGEFLDVLEWMACQVRRSGQPFGGIQVVITGDFFQLPPVRNNSSDVKFAFEAACWSKCIHSTIQLTHVFRQRDDRFVRILNEIRVGAMSKDSLELLRSLSREPTYPNDGILPTRLFALRAEVDSANDQRLERLSGSPQTYTARDSGKDPIQVAKLPNNCLAPTALRLRKDAQVILLKNLDATLVNGSRGIVIGFETREKDAGGEMFPVVRFENGRTLQVTPELWDIEVPGEGIVASRQQVPLLLAWAMSIHKSQGQTLERVVVDLARIFENGQAYVALSRATSIEGLQVLNFNAQKIRANPRVVEFYKRLDRVM
jgi:ATP-dependent DNA helicase PIF1